MKNKLIPMTDFVLEQSKQCRNGNIILNEFQSICESYASFLNQRTDYLIMARHMGEITKEIEGVGVPIVELAKINVNEPCEYLVLHNKYDFSVKICNYSIFSYEKGCFTSFDFMEGEYKIIPQLPFFQWLYTNHFAVDIPEELITPI